MLIIKQQLMAAKQLFLVLTLIIASFFFFNELESDRYLRGPDAYYYALQADHWARTGEVKIPDSSFVHRINGLLQKTGLKTETAIRLFSASSYLILGVLTLLLLARPSCYFGMALTTSWLLVSPSLAFNSIEFPKLFSLLLLVPIWLYFLRQDAYRKVYACVPLGLSLFAHKAAIPIAGLSLLGLISECLSWQITKRRFIAVTSSALVVSIFSYIQTGDHFNLLDMKRLGGWDNLLPGVISLLGRAGLPLAIKIEILLTFGLFVFTLGLFVKKTNNWQWPVFYCMALILPGLFPFSSNEVFGIGERYAILLPFFFVAGSLFVMPLCNAKTSAKGDLFATVLLTILFLVAIPFRVSYSHPQYLDPENETYERITKNLRKQDIPMLIAHRGFNFYYKFATGKEAFHYEPESHWDKSMIWRLSYGISPDEFAYFLPDTCGWNSGLVQNIGDKDYFLIREDCWDSFRSKIDIDNDQHLYQRVWTWWRNPSQHRPDFLYQKHKNDNRDEAFSTFESKK